MQVDIYGVSFPTNPRLPWWWWLFLAIAFGVISIWAFLGFLTKWLLYLFGIIYLLFNAILAFVFRKAWNTLPIVTMLFATFWIAVFAVFLFYESLGLFAPICAVEYLIMTQMHFSLAPIAQETRAIAYSLIRLANHRLSVTDILDLLDNPEDIAESDLQQITSKRAARINKRATDAVKSIQNSQTICCIALTILTLVGIRDIIFQDEQTEYIGFGIVGGTLLLEKGALFYCIKDAKVARQLTEESGQ